jgi:putative phosphoribosyl transferase
MQAGGGCAMSRFADRRDAGRQLAAVVGALSLGDAVVLGLPRGGVPVAAEVARAIRAPLDVLVVRKLGLPWQPELAMGAIAAAGDAVETVRTPAAARTGEDAFAAVHERELIELRRRERAYRAGHEPVPLAHRAVVLVDDGLATGATMRAAAEALRQLGPARVVVAVPVAAPETCDEFQQYVDEIVCLLTPEPFHAVGMWYENFDQTTDDEVRELLEEARQNVVSG